MTKYKNERVLKLVGQQIERQRIKLGLELEDVAEMTGFTYNTIRNMELGSETTLSYFVEVCLAIGIHPKEIFNFKINIKPKYQLSPTRKEKSRLTNRINEYIRQNYFQADRSTSDVVLKIKEDYNIKTSTSAVSVILNRMVKNDLLKTNKKNNKNYYKRK